MNNTEIDTLINEQMHKFREIHNATFVHWTYLNWTVEVIRILVRLTDAKSYEERMRYFAYIAAMCRAVMSKPKRIE